MTLPGERYLLFQFRCVNLDVLSKLLLVALHDEGVRMVCLRCGFEEVGWVVFQGVHPRLQIGDVVLVELALKFRVLDAEVCGKEQASKLRDQLFLSIGRASEAGVEFTGEGGWVSGGVGHLMQQDAGERFIRAKGLSRGDEDAVGSRRVGGTSEVAAALDDGASGRLLKVLCDGCRSVVQMDGSVLRRDALDILRIEDVPVAHELRVASGKFLLAGILVFLVSKGFRWVPVPTPKW